MAERKETGANPSSRITLSPLAAALLALLAMWIGIGLFVWHLTNIAQEKGELIGAREGMKLGREAAYMEDMAALQKAGENCGDLQLCAQSGCVEARIYCRSKYNP